MTRSVSRPSAAIADARNIAESMEKVFWTEPGMPHTELIVATATNPNANLGDL